ncbi:MAG: sensor histidine kinase [Burkholderiales bacterium]|nr:sensor histidine kinase [Burkholderiales bacterium]
MATTKVLSATEAQPDKASETYASIASAPRHDHAEWLNIEEALRVTRAQLQQRSAQQLMIQENERRRIAMELHDGLGQTLSLAKLSMQEAIKSVNIGVIDNARANLERAATHIKLAMEDLRRIAMNLRPSALDELGILATLAWYFREFEATCPHMKLERDIGVSESDVPEALKITIFRIVQESANNAMKHAGANRIKVALNSEGDVLELLIEDTGRGFDPAAVAAERDFEHGLGLRGMQERAELSGASYTMKSAPGQGTSICVRWPSTALSDPKCPVIPVSQVLAQMMRRPAPTRESPRQYSACLNCLRSMESN